jgi:molybdate transport system ATP-binding protein
MSTWDLNVKYKAKNGDFTVDFTHKWESRITGLQGASGSGKSTLIEILLGLRDHNDIDGHARVDGRTIFGPGSLPPTRKRKLAWVPQENTLFPHMTVLRNLLFTHANIYDIDRVSEKLNLISIFNKVPEELSGGQRQKVALARALLTNSDTILLDEPLNALDKSSRTELVHWLKKTALKFDRNFIYVSHDQSEIDQLCDYSITIEDGQISNTQPISQD